MYGIIFKKFKNETFTSPWLKYVKNTLDNCGLTNVWLWQSLPSCMQLALKLRQVLEDQYRQEWESNFQNSPKCILYKCFKSDLKFESYSVDNKFRTSNHKLPVKKGRFSKLLRNMRIWENCDCNKLCNEYHFLLECPALNYIQKKIIKKYYWQRSNILKFEQLMSTLSYQEQILLVKFIKYFLKFIICIFDFSQVGSMLEQCI